MRTKQLALSAITVDVEIQQRASGISVSLVGEFASDLENGATFPPVRVFRIGKSDTYLLSRGFHRYAAHAEHGDEKIAAEVFSGSRKDAILDACGANASHGLRRTNADKRKAVTTALGLKPNISDRWLAEKCGVSDRFVNGLRDQLRTVRTSEPSASGEPEEEPSAPATRVGRDGKSYPAPKPKPKGKTYPAWDRYEKIILNVIALLDGLLAEYDRSVSVMIASKDWDQRRTQMAANYAAECTKSFDKLAKEFEGNVEAEIS